MKRCILFILFLMLSSCGFIERKHLMEQKYPTYPFPIRQAIDAHRVIEGMNYEQVYLSIGPTLCKNWGVINGVRMEIWAYDKQILFGTPMLTADCRGAPIRIYFQNAQVYGWENLNQ